MDNVSENNKRIARNTLYMYFRMLVLMAVSFFAMRIVFNALGIDDFGIYNIVGSIIVLFSFINNGLVLTTKRYVTAELVKGTIESQRNVFCLSLVSHLLVAAIIFVLAETVGLWCVNNMLNITSARMTAANVVYQFSIATAIVSVIQSPFISVIVAYERMSAYAYFSIIDGIIKLLTAFLLLWSVWGDNLIVYSILLFFASLVSLAYYGGYCRNCFPICRLQKPHNRRLLKEMFTFTGWSLFGQGTAVLTTQGTNVLVNMFYSVAANAAVGVSNTITNVVSGFCNNFQVAFNPQITKYYVSGDYKELNTLVGRASRYSSFLVLLFIIPIMFQTENILQIWLGNYPDYAVEFCRYTLVDVYLGAFIGPLWMVMYSDKDIKSYQLIISGITMLNLVFSYMLLLIGFPPYVVAEVRVAVTIIGLVARLVLLKKRIRSFDIEYWLTDVVGRSAFVSILPLTALFFMKNLHFQNSIIECLVYTLASAIFASLSVYCFGLYPAERRKATEIVCSKLIKVV